MADPLLGATANQKGIAATTIVTAVIIDLVVILRFVVRKLVVKSLGWDDLAILLATITCNFGTALVLVEIHYGFGRHRLDIPPSSYINYLRFSYFEWIQTFQTLMFTKIAICLLLLRIVISKSFVYTLWMWIALLLISNLVLTFLWMAQCNPIWLAWESPLQPGACFSENQLQWIILAQAVVSVISDFILSAYPIFIIRKLKMPQKRKIGLSLLMGLGVLTGGLCTARTVLNWQNVNNDSSWNVIPNWYLRSWEVTMGFVAACVPALYPGYRSLCDRLRNYSYSLSRSSRSKTQEKMPPSQLSRATKPLPALPPPFLPSNAQRYDRRLTQIRTGIRDSDNSPYPPIQNRRSSEATNALEIDLEDQRALSVISQSDVDIPAPRSIMAWDSRTALRKEVGF